MDDPDHDDSTHERYQQGGNADCPTNADCGDTDEGADQVTGQESADDAHNNIDQQAGAVLHDLACHPADDSRGNQIDNDVHGSSLLLVCVGVTEDPRVGSWQKLSSMTTLSWVATSLVVWG